MREIKYNFYEFRKQFPPDRFDNGIDWLKAEENRLVALKDYIKGVSIKKFKKFTAIMPREYFDNELDRDKAIEDGIITPAYSILGRITVGF